MSLGHSESGFDNKQYNFWIVSNLSANIYVEPSEIRRGGNDIFLPAFRWPAERLVENSMTFGILKRMKYLGESYLALSSAIRIALRL